MGERATKRENKATTEQTQFFGWDDEAVAVVSTVAWQPAACRASRLLSGLCGFSPWVLSLGSLPGFSSFPRCTLRTCWHCRVRHFSQDNKQTGKQTHRLHPRTPELVLGVVQATLVDTRVNQRASERRRSRGGWASSKRVCGRSREREPQSAVFGNIWN